MFLNLLVPYQRVPPRRFLEVDCTLSSSPSTWGTSGFTFTHRQHTSIYSCAKGSSLFRKFRGPALSTVFYTPLHCYDLADISLEHPHPPSHLNCVYGICRSIDGLLKKLPNYPTHELPRWLVLTLIILHMLKEISSSMGLSPWKTNLS